MTIENLWISFNPNQNQLDEIQNWLILEENESGEGFYCNWSIISNAFSKDQMAIILLNSCVVGFAVWKYPDNLTAEIDIVEIIPTQRNKGLCKHLILNLFEYFKNRNIYAVDLQCNPASSEPIWRKLGFIDFPIKGDENMEGYNKELYCVLIPSSKETNTYDNNEIIELWNDEPHRTNKREPNWIWNLEYKIGTRELFMPIVHPCDGNWRIRWKLMDNVLIDSKIKHFNKGNVHFGKYLIIEKLPELT